MHNVLNIFSVGKLPAKTDIRDKLVLPRLGYLIQGEIGAPISAYRVSIDLIYSPTTSDSSMFCFLG